LRQVAFEVDRVDLAQETARAALHALLGVDVHGPVALVDAVDGAFLHASLVLDVNARTGDHVGHGRKPICNSPYQTRVEGPARRGLKSPIPGTEDVLAAQGVYAAMLSEAAQG